MGVFERFGEKVERFKQEAVAAREANAEYRCRNCGAGIYSDRETCPECGSDAIARVAAETDADENDNENDVQESETESDELEDPETKTESNAKSDGDEGATTE